MTEDTTVVDEAESKRESPEEIMRKELLTSDWAALKDYIWRTFRENPKSAGTKSNLKVLKNMIANEDDLAQVKANLSVASIYFDRVDFLTLFLGLTTVLVSLSGDFIARILIINGFVTEAMSNILGLGFTLFMWFCVGIRISKRFAESKDGMQNIKHLEILINTFTQRNDN